MWVSDEASGVASRTGGRSLERYDYLTMWGASSSESRRAPGEGIPCEGGREDDGMPSSRTQVIRISYLDGPLPVCQIYDNAP